MEEEITFNPALYQDVTPIYVKTPLFVLLIILKHVCKSFKTPFSNDLVRDAMAYYRALMQKNEISERALLLTGIIIDLNSADYSAWYYRRRILKAFQDTYDITKEYDFIESLGDNVSKNYQVWGHRQYIVGLTGDYLKELDFVNQMLEDDNKNYHCWSHRVWICNKFNCWAGELAYTQQMIDKDIRNNSAWSHRFFTLKHLGFFNDLEKLRIELGVIEKSLHSSANNEAVWTYLTGLYENALNEDFKVECKEFIQRMIDERQFSVYAKITYVNIFVNTPKVKEIVLELRDRLDVAHKNYWEWYLKFLSA